MLAVVDTKPKAECEGVPLYVCVCMCACVCECEGGGLLAQTFT